MLRLKRLGIELVVNIGDFVKSENLEGMNLGPLRLKAASWISPESGGSFYSFSINKMKEPDRGPGSSYGPSSYYMQLG